MTFEAQSWSDPSGHNTLLFRPYTLADVPSFYAALDAERSRLAHLGVTETMPRLSDIAEVILDNESGLRGGVFMQEDYKTSFVGTVYCTPVRTDQFKSFPPAGEKPPAVEVSYWRVSNPALKGVMDEPIRRLVGIVEQQREARGWGDLYALVRAENQPSQTLVGRLGYHASCTILDLEDRQWSAYLLSPKS